HVAEAAVEDQLRGHPGVRAAEDHRERVLLGADLGASVDALAGVQHLTADEPCVALPQGLPGLGGSLSRGHVGSSSARVGGFAPGLETVIAAIRAAQLIALRRVASSIACSRARREAPRRPAVHSASTSPAM